VRANIGYLPEDSPFPPELSARETLDLAAALQGLGAPRAAPGVPSACSSWSACASARK
jgi:ABC-type multidrug transport system ATPase subunit